MKEPSAAPIENPRYIKEALRERMTGALLSPVIPIKRVCSAGKKPQSLVSNQPPELLSLP
jgi:hypothetical protein